MEANRDCGSTLKSALKLGRNLGAKLPLCAMNSRSLGE
jgi:hypothetical protein